MHFIPPELQMELLTELQIVNYNLEAGSILNFLYTSHAVNHTIYGYGKQTFEKDRPP